jgi:FkbH-like protein
MNIVLAVSATFTPELMVRHIEWWGRQFGMEIETTFAAYNQVFQELLDEYGLISTNTGVNLLMVRFEDWLRYVDLPDDRAREKLERDFGALVNIFTRKPKKVPYFIGIFPVSTHLELSPAVARCIRDLNHRWKEIVENTVNAHIIDFTRLAELYRIDNVFNPVMDKGGHMPFSREFFAAMGTMMVRKLNALLNPPFEAIVIDRENTLNEGKTLELERMVLRKRREGMRLALCGHAAGADGDVKRRQAGTLLTKEYFAGWKFNGTPTWQKINELAQEWNLPLDRFIFISRDAGECSQVMSNCPQVLSLPLPRDPGEIPGFLNHVWALDQKIDNQQTKKITGTANTDQVSGGEKPLKAFLRGLELKVAVEPMKSSQVKIVSQMTDRISHFNLSTIIRSEDEIISLSQQEDIDIRLIDVADRFGDYGITGLVITRKQDDHLFIDTFLLSCRVLGRTVEDAVLAGLKKYCEHYRLPALKAKFIPTAGNKPFWEFIRRTQWEKVEETGDYIVFMLAIDRITPASDYIDWTFLLEVRN